MSGRTAKARRRAAAAAATPGRKLGPVQAPKRLQEPMSRRTRLVIITLVTVVVAVVGLYVVTSLAGRSGGGAEAGGGNGDAAAQSASGFRFDVGSPGPAEPAPPVELASTGGGTFDLAAYEGKEQVLLYFQEGLMCQPCWDQIVAIEKELPKFQALGVGPLVSITGDPLDLIEQKVADEGIKSPVVSDPTFEVSDSYDARRYGMMNGEMAGHSFILVDTDGTILWRADYGGPPDYTMFVPVDALLKDLRAGLGKST